MKFKKMFSIILMTVLCFNIVSMRVFADNVTTENIASQENLKTTKNAQEKIMNELEDVFSSNLTDITYTQTETVYAAAKKSSVSKAAYSKSDLRLLSAIIYCEAQGESYAGKLAVGVVVMNRKSSSKFPNTIKGVIYQKNQFQPVRSGALDKALKKYDNGKFTSKAAKQCIKAAKEALSGTKAVTYNSKKLNLKGYYFFSRTLSGCRLKIGNHQFK